MMPADSHTLLSTPPEAPLRSASTEGTPHLAPRSLQAGSPRPALRTTTSPAQGAAGLQAGRPPFFHLKGQERHQEARLMFINLGPAIDLIREVRGMTQAELASSAGIGKSQLSKYINRRAVPTMEVLARILTVLEVGYPHFFYIVQVLDRVDAADPEGLEVMGLLSQGTTLLPKALEERFGQILRDLLTLHGQVFAAIFGRDAIRSLSDGPES
jgi:transcriptional regulator with XRE-family HTH domain